MNARIVFASASVLGDLNNLGLAGVTYQNVVPTWLGSSITRATWGAWSWDIVPDPLLTEFRNGAMFVVQPRYITYKPFRATIFQANMQGNDNTEIDYVKDGFLTEANFRVELEEIHAYVNH
jgi:hypothetical protein